ncbi:uncharacterized protein BP5553_03888 [Venustampulla echinocandica]|uniref:RING-type domain-containing protein n=1 Tax=Venustampulla echinocandica TaxID=2656787 RepID=A0A370TVP9_9HELO|nr:uncharacterized protein BP5553_03888 [Venustampulla echinocandica]RDL39548.1 hypothetical protein BP5553_03888 [Venustampulla echinocandica]
MSEIFELDLAAEEIWDLHTTWHNLHEDEQPDSKLMEGFMDRVGVRLEVIGTPLSETLPPKTAAFAKYWSPQASDGRPLCQGLTAFARERSQAWLISQNKVPSYDRFTPAEEPVVAMFGTGVASIMKDVIKRWADAMGSKLGEDQRLRPIKPMEQGNLIMKYITDFQQAYELMYGKIEDSRSILGEPRDEIPHIRSTGHGAKLLLGLMMTDRLRVFCRLRTLERMEIGFRELEVKDLEQDSRKCPICQDEIGVQDVDGSKESPIVLVICCGQIIGEACLKRWLLDRYDETRDSCPICRFEFPKSFLNKLLGEDWYDEWDFPDEGLDADDYEIINLISPSPNPPSSPSPEAQP